MIANTGQEPTVSDDPKLYSYTPDNAPHDVVINVGTAPLIITAPKSVSDPHRIEVGDRRKGDYYVGLIGKIPGLMPLHRVDPKRMTDVNKIRDIRTGMREPDWVKAARKRSEERGAEQPIPFNPHSDQSPLQRAAQGL